MPRYPNSNPTSSALLRSPFSSLESRLAGYPSAVCPLHFGDTWLDPPIECHPQSLETADFPDLHRYAPPEGLPELRSVIAERTEQRTGMPTAASNVLIGAGATGVLTAVAASVVAPGDEVLLLAPYWPLIAGIVRLFGGRPVDVSFLGGVDTAQTLVERVERALTERTVALYLNSPNNPTGKVLPRAWIEALTEWAVRHGLWVISDEVYEDYVYVGEHTYCRMLVPEHCFTVSSFSKMYGMAGHRCGYVVAREELIRWVLTTSTHTIYSAPHVAQVAALRALRGNGSAWASEAAAKYRGFGAEMARLLGVEPPEAGNFLFVDVSDKLDERGLQGFLEDCAEQGVLVAPGPSFGPFPTHVRICFTIAPPDLVREGVERLARILDH